MLLSWKSELGVVSLPFRTFSNRSNKEKRQMLLIAFTFCVFIQGCNANVMSKIGDILERNNHKFIVVPNNWLQVVNLKLLMQGMISKLLFDLNS